MFLIRLVKFQKDFLVKCFRRTKLVVMTVCVIWLLRLTSVKLSAYTVEKKYFYNRYKGYPLTIYDNPYKINTIRTCVRFTHLDMIIVIHSKATNFNKRSSIRRTWGNKQHLSKNSMELVFFLGQPLNEDFQSLVQQESLEYNDIVQGHFYDSYTNITHKAVLWIRWVKEYCQNAAFILKLDDDVFANLFTLSRTFLPKNRHESKKNWCEFIPVGKGKIQRQLGDKHRVADYELKGLTYFPVDLCRGYFVILTQDNIIPLYETSKETRFFWIDDYYVFGDLAHKIEAQHVCIANLLREEYEAFKCFEDKSRKCAILGALMSSADAMEKLWILLYGRFS